MSHCINRLLIANRGEIAVRVIQSAHKLGIKTVAVYSDADKDSLHVRLADAAVHIGASPATASYLNIDAVIAAVKCSGADAVHPGYGFLSENAAFAAAVQEAGALFVGPSANVIEEMGDKRAARQIAKTAGVPVVPGFDGDDSDAALLKSEAEKIGYPLMIKATAGGGGRGLRRVNHQSEFLDALESARREAGAAFGNTSVMLEKMITDARHVEVQILGDNHGNVVHLFERDCSAQRRHQKVIEEAPCATINDETRHLLYKAAVDLAKAVHYSGSGTVEFLVDETGGVYFLEMNTRLQVEHPVTEWVTGVDLVEQQVRIARNEKLGLTQDDIRVKGHAVEARLYAEKPEEGFLPQTGVLGVMDIPTSHNTRLDNGFGPGDTVSPFYDPMLAKLIAYGDTRDSALNELLSMIRNSRITGVSTNKTYLVDILASDAFQEGRHRTHSLDSQTPEKVLTDCEGAPLLAAVLEAEACDGFPISELSGWRTTKHSAQTRVLEMGDQRYRMSLTSESRGSGRSVTVTHSEGETTYHVGNGRIKVGDTFHDYALTQTGDQCHLDIGFADISAKDVTHAPAETSGGVGSGILTAPMDGQVVAVGASKGETVKTGDLIVVIEAMKMEHRICADVDGTVQELTASVGDQVKSKASLAVIEQHHEAGE